jgi:hypothetical protein
MVKINENNYLSTNLIDRPPLTKAYQNLFDELASGKINI